jgi:hypothetical protein
MATAKKTPAKKAPAKKAALKKAVTSSSEQLFTMPVEVSEWIERAQSIMKHQKGEIERLKLENKDLKAYKKFAETRILRSDYE